MRLFQFLMFFSLLTPCMGQQTVDSSFSFQDEEKEYSIYIPSSYDSSQANQLMIGFHPLNTSRWDAQSWRDTLIYFAEANNLILACPDGGPDGKVDDPIDTSFTTVLLDSLGTWYNIDRTQQYAIGFSWGARTAYSYSMNHPNVFKGIIPVGAAIDGTIQFIDVISNASQMDFYIVHGDNDSPSVRYNPVLEAFLENGVCHESQLLTNVGHTIDFPMRNEILGEAFAFVSADNNCIANATSNPDAEISSIQIFPNPSFNGEVYIQNEANLEIVEYRLFDLQGKMIYQLDGKQNILRTNQQLQGVYILDILHKNGFSEIRKITFAK